MSCDDVEERPWAPPNVSPLLMMADRPMGEWKSTLCSIWKLCIQSMSFFFFVNSFQRTWYASTTWSLFHTVPRSLFTKHLNVANILENEFSCKSQEKKVNSCALEMRRTIHLEYWDYRRYLSLRQSSSGPTDAICKHHVCLISPSYTCMRRISMDWIITTLRILAIIFGQREFYLFPYMYACVMNFFAGQ